MSVIAVCSGGLDSVTLAGRLAAQGESVHILGFDYGQRHRRELDFARACAERLGAPFTCLDITGVAEQLSPSALTGTGAIPDGHYAEESMKLTVVPNRNAIMLAIAFGVATGRGAGAVAIAVHGGDHFVYPDCRPGFISAFAGMQQQALDGIAGITLHAPYLSLTKADIVREGVALGIPLGQTWSCYRGGDRHCGRCGTCVERREAFFLAGIPDPAPCEDPEYWKQVTGRGTPGHRGDQE